MSWCPRCDVIRAGAAGEECFECGADLLDSAVLGRPTRKGNHVLELEREAPPIEDDLGASPTDVTHAPETETPKISLRRRVPMRRLVIGGICLLGVLASSLVFASHRDRAHRRLNPLADSTPTGSPAVQTASPPFGSPVQGRLVFVTANSLVAVDLNDGTKNTVHIDGDIGFYQVSPDGSYGSYIDGHGTLWVMNGIAVDVRHAVETGVQAYTWMRDNQGALLLVVRSELNPHGGSTTRLEVIDPSTDLPTNLLYEGRTAIASVFAAGKTVAVGCDVAGWTGTCVVERGRLDLIGRNYIPLALSPDGTYVLAIRQGEGGMFGFARLDLGTHKVRKVGPDTLTPTAATFDNDGTAVVYDGGSVVYRIDPSRGKATRLPGTADEFLGAPIKLANGRWLYVERRSSKLVFQIGPQTFAFGLDDVADIAAVTYVAM